MKTSSGGLGWALANMIAIFLVVGFVDTVALLITCRVLPEVSLGALPGLLSTHAAFILFSCLMLSWDGGRELLRPGEMTGDTWNWRVSVKPVLACLVWSVLVIFLGQRGFLAPTKTGEWEYTLLARPMTELARLWAAILTAAGWSVFALCHCAAWCKGQLGWWAFYVKEACFLLICLCQTVLVVMTEILNAMVLPIPMSGAAVIYPLLVALGICVLLSWWRGKRKLEDALLAARKVLCGGGELRLLAAGTLRGALSERDLILEDGGGAERRPGSAVCCGEGYVLADYNLFRYGLLAPLADTERRMAVLLDETSLFTVCSNWDRAQLQKLAEEGWKLLAVTSGLTSEEIDYSNSRKWALIADLPIFIKRGVPEKERKRCVQEWFSEQSSHLSDEIVLRLGRALADTEEQMKKDDGSAPFLKFAQESCRKLTLKYDTVHCFYLLLMTAQYIVHCRALMCCRRGGAEAPSFPDSVSFGKLVEKQRGWPCGPAWTEHWEELRAAAEVLQKAGGMDGKIRTYGEVCAVLARLRNEYLAHGSPMHQVKEAQIEALVTVVEYLLRDFCAQGAFPGPEDQVPVGKERLLLPACLREGEDVWLLSFLPQRSVDGKGAEYLNYRIGRVRWLETRRGETMFRMDYLPEEGGKG